MEWIGAALHLFFHCVDDHDGTIDKYTGDAAELVQNIPSLGFAPTPKFSFIYSRNIYITSDFPEIEFFLIFLND